MEFLPLHTVPNYFRECAELLNEEWKRSLNARLHSLEKSCDAFPICLVLLEKGQSGSFSVVGHSRLSDIRGQADRSCLVESVVVKKNQRGKGYGRKVMEKTEKYAASKGYETMYLTTHDKQDFYKHLGYEFCSPIICFDSSIVPEHLAQQLLGNMALSGDNKSAKSVSPSKASSATDSSRTGQNNSNETGKSTEKVDPSSKLSSSAAPPAPPVPPIAPPPPAKAPPMAQPPPPLQDKKETPGHNDKTVMRWDPKLVSWMKKDLKVL